MLSRVTETPHEKKSCSVFIFPMNEGQGMPTELGEKIAIRGFHRRERESSILSGWEHRLQSQIESGSNSGAVTY